MINSLHIINQLFEMQGKLKEIGQDVHFERNFNRLFAVFNDEGFVIQDPTNEPYTEARTDCEASITGHPSSRMKIIKTLKPVIYQKKESEIHLIQKAVVIVAHN